MEPDAVIKLLASGGLTVVLLYISSALWKAYQEQVKGRIDDLSARIDLLEGRSAESDKTATPK
jgi:hypothetical protein